MTERIVFSTQDLVMIRAQDQISFEGFFGATCTLERVLFEGGSWAEATIYNDTETGRLLNITHSSFVLPKHITFTYDHNFWAPPFSGPGFMPDPNAPYKAVIDFRSLSSDEAGNLRFSVRYGTFWYDQEGQLKTVRGGTLTRSKFDTPQTPIPTLRFRRIPSGRWEVFRVVDVGLEGPTFAYILTGKISEPEEEAVENGQEIAFDEIISSLSDDNGRFKFHQRTLTGLRQKTIEVPSCIDIPRWSTTLNTLNGGWTEALSEFPSRIELLV